MRPAPRPHDARRGLADHVAARVVPPLGEMGDRGTILTPLLLVSLFSLLALAGIDPLLPAALADDPARLALVRTWTRVLGVLAPAIALGKGALLATAAWSVLVLVGGRPRFPAVLSATLYGEVVLALQGVWISFVLHLRAGGGSLGSAELLVPSGLDALVTPASPVLATVVHGLSVFHLAWVALLCVAFAEGAGTSRARGAVAALAAWGLVVGVGALRAALG